MRWASDRLDLAFSQDQEAKTYVQTRMKENGKAMFSWLRDNSSFYVSGEASRMAGDVDSAFDIIAQHGGLTPEKAAEYVVICHKPLRIVQLDGP